MESGKGVDVLLKTWSTLPSSFQLTLIGGGERLPELKSKYECENIRFLGSVDRPEVIQQIASARYLLQTSLLYETFGLTIVEAFGQGTPVIGFDIGPRSEFVKDGINGFLCVPETLKATLEKAKITDHYSELCKNARETALKFEETKVLDNQISIYKGLRT